MSLLATEQIIVDECHHLPAVSFELVARRSKAKYVLGLSATVVRKDGHHPIIFMQCGPIRHRVDAKSQTARSTFEHRVVIKETSIRSSISAETERPPIAHIYQELANNERRNALIFDDVLSALEEGRCPIVLTERRQHLDHLADRFQSFVRNLIVLRGGMKVGERKAAQSLINDDDIDERLILATGRYIGEGFDDPRLDTLFLVMPISWRGTLAQYVGRLHREHDGKGEVIVYDYADIEVPVLAKWRPNDRRAIGASDTTSPGTKPSVRDCYSCRVFRFGFGYTELNLFAQEFQREWKTFLAEVIHTKSHNYILQI